MRKWNADRILLIGLAVVFCVFLYVIHDLFEQRVIDVGDRAPDFAVTTENGRRITESEFGGKLLILNFWATWCPPCVEEMPSLNEFARQMSDSGVVVLGVSVDKNERAYKQFLERSRLQFQVARDPEADIPTEYGTFRWPETYVIDRNGKVILKYIGPKDWTSSQIVNEVRAHL